MSPDLDRPSDRDWVARHLGLLEGPLPEAVARHLGLLVADTIAIGAHARAGGIGATAYDLAGADIRAAAADGSATEGGATVWGDGRRLAPLDAALLNGTAAEVLDYQEVLINGRNNGHAAVVIVPALLALAQARALPAERLLRALWVAFAANIGLGEALGRGHRSNGPGFRTTSLTAGPAAALGAAALVSDAPQVALAALGIAACTLPAGLLAAMNSRDGAYSVDKDLSVGLSANHALRCALWAEAGATGPEAPLTGPRGWLASYGMGSAEPAHLATPPRARDLTAYAIKRYPANFGCQAAVRALLGLRAELGARPGGALPGRLRIEVKSSSAETLNNRRIANHIAARFSLAYVAASTWLRGHARLEDFAPAAVADPEVAALMERVEVIAGEGMEVRHLRLGVFPARVTVLDGAGTVLGTRAHDGPFDGEDAAAQAAAFGDKLASLCPPALAAALGAFAAAPLAKGRLAALWAALDGNGE